MLPRVKATILSPLTEEGIKKMWYLYTVEYYSATKNEIMPFAATWMDLEIIMLSEISQTKISYDIPYMWNLNTHTHTHTHTRTCF